MKVLHTSDWHLGKRFFNRSLIEEQQLFIQWLLHKVETESIQLLIVAGDIFDVPHPPTHAIELFNLFLARVAKIAQLKTLIIPGNHDSSRFLYSLKPLLKEENIKIICQISEFKSIQALEHNGTKVRIQSLPYFKWSELLSLKNELQIEADDEIHILESIFRHFCQEKEDESVKIFVGHHLFGNYQESGSEQGLHLSGVNTIPLRLLAPYFDLMTLGHMHRSQVISKSNPLAIYSGAPMIFRFREAGERNIVIYNIQNKNIQYEYHSVPVFRPIISISCHQNNWEEVIKEKLKDHQQQKTTPYLEVSLSLDAPDAHLCDQVKEYIQEFDVELINFKSSIANQKEEVDSFISNNIEQFSTEKLFEIYYQHRFGVDEQIPHEIKKDFLSVLQECRHSHETTNQQEFKQ